MGGAKPLASGEILKLRIGDFYFGKLWWDLHPWRLALAEMIGAEIDYRVHARPFTPAGDFAIPDRLDVLEADSIGGAHAMTVTPAMRAGTWAETPEEPLLVLLLLSLPGRSFPARHAAAIVDRLVELDEIMHALDDGRYTVHSLTHLHEAATAFFRRQAEAGRDVPVHAWYTDGRTDFDTEGAGAFAP